MSAAIPLAQLRQYVAVLRSALWEGKVEHQGRFFTARATLDAIARAPLLVSALADSAVSWNCPPPYLADIALHARGAGAQAAGRAAAPLVAHLWVALSDDREAVVAARTLGGNARLPFYEAMFSAAGCPVQPDGEPPPATLDGLLISGDEAHVADRIGAPRRHQRGALRQAGTQYEVKGVPWRYDSVHFAAMPTGRR